MPKVYAGMRQGLLVVLDRSHRKGANYYWTVRCDCGVTKSISHSSIVGGQRVCSNSAHPARLAHGMTGTRTYSVWQSMKQRCYDEASTSYPRYGAKGIRVCDRWHDFQNFLSDMGQVRPGMTLDRIDPRGDYSPHNCRWATQREQQNNRTNNRRIVIDGVERTVAEWAVLNGVPVVAAHTRIYKGWEPVDAVTRPFTRRSKDQK